MGFEVHLFEKNPEPGGRMGRIEGGGFVFDTGPTLLLMTDVYRELFRFAGRRLEDYLDLVPLDGDYRIHFGDGGALTMRRSLPELVLELERLEPGVTPRFYRFLESAALKYRLGRGGFVERDFERARDFFNLHNLWLLLRTGALANYYRSVSRYFRTEHLRQAFSLQTMYLGLSPFEAPAVYALLPYTELAEDGLWFPRGGMYSLAEALTRLALELGARIHLRSPVERVLVSKGRARGLRVDGEDLPFDAVVVNADLPYAYRVLLGGAADGDFRLRRRGRLRYTASAYMLYLGLGTRAEGLLHHNFFLSARYRKNFEDIFARRVLPEDPSFYVAAPSRTDPGMAPEGGESLLVLVPVPHLGGEVDWGAGGVGLPGEGVQAPGGTLRGRAELGPLRAGPDPRGLAGGVQPGAGCGLRARARHLPGGLLQAPARLPERGRAVLRGGQHPPRDGGAAGGHRGQAGGGADGTGSSAAGGGGVRVDPAGSALADGGLSLEGCYRLCRNIQRAHSRTYYFSTRLLEQEVRRGVHALYAFMRYADEIVDNPGTLPPNGQLAALEDLEEETLAALGGGPTENPVLRAFADTARRCGIEERHIRSFMRSMKMDTSVTRYPTYRDLEEYTHGSAAVVGIMMCRVLGVEDVRAYPHAEALGTAMQLTNFLRDIAEDWRRGRVYLPLEDLERFGYKPGELGEGVVDERFAGLMRFEILRARRLYAVADEGMGYIPRGRRYAVLVARELYAAILDRIEESGYDVFSRRAETSWPQKLTLAAGCALREPGEILSGLCPARIATGS